MTGNLIAGNGHILNVAALHLGEQLRKADLVAAHMHARALEQVEESNEQQEDEDPDGEVTKVRVHELTWKLDLNLSAARPPPKPSPRRGRENGSSLGNIGTCGFLAK